MPVDLKFRSFEESLTKLPHIKSANDMPLDINIKDNDSTKPEKSLQLGVCFYTLDAFRKKYKRDPNPWNMADFELFSQLGNDLES